MQRSKFKFNFEGLVAQILRAYGDYHALFKTLSYWSPADARKTEVDFLLETEDGLIAIEVKSSNQVSSQDYKGLRAIKDLPALKKRILIYPGKDIRKTNENIDIWPFNYFCKMLEKKSL